MRPPPVICYTLGSQNNLADAGDLRSRRLAALPGAKEYSDWVF